MTSPLCRSRCQNMSRLLVALACLALPRQGFTQAPAGQKPEFVRAPDALERVTWRTRTLIGDDRLTRWKLAIPTGGWHGLTFLDGVIRADAAVVDFVEGASTQLVSAEVRKPLDWNLTADERAMLRDRMGPVRMIAYRVDDFPVDAATQRKVFEFAKAMGVETIVTTAKIDLSQPGTLADEFGLNLAYFVAAPQTVADAGRTIDRLSQRVGIGATARDALAAGPRLMYVDLTGATAEFFHELNRRNLRPLMLSLNTAGLQNAGADLYRAIEAFEALVQPAFGEHFTRFAATRPIRRDLVRPAKGETPTDAELARRSAEVLDKIRASIPARAYAAAKKPRRLLVVESLHGMSHDTIPHANVMLEEMGRKTGAWTTVFSNDLNNLKYPAIAEYDAVFLNSIVGEFAADLEVRAGLARFVREGGGLGGVHGTPWASRNWDEFAEMIGSQSAPHRIEQGVMKVYDAASPIMKPLGGKDLPFREEYYRFEHEGRGRLRWENVRVLMSVALDDPAIEPRPWTGYKRPDNVYPVTWIRTYGKGRVFYSSLGHMPETFMTPELVGHFLAGVQFMLGDLDADTTPNPLRAGSQQPSTPPPSIPSISKRPTGTSLGTIRVGAADANIWFGWRVGMPSTAIRGLTFSDALARADAHPIAVTSVVASSTQMLSPEVPKPFDYRLQPGERRAVVYRLRELNQQLLAYHVDNLSSDRETRRKVFEFAKAITAPMIVVNGIPDNLADLDALAGEFEINVALMSGGDPRSVVTVLQGRSTRLGVALDVAPLIKTGVKPAEALISIKEKLLLVRTPAVGEQTNGVSDLFLAAYRVGVKPLSIVIAPTGATEADYAKDLNGFERLMWPAMAERVRAMLNSPAGQIRGSDRLDAQMRQQIDAGAPRKAAVTPRRPRKLLVTDIQMYSGHSTIPHGNLLIELMAKYTGAFEPVFSNDLNLLKYPQIKQFDAVYLNNVCGMVHNDPEVRDGLLRFVREGGGIGGHHAVTFANNNWPEFAEMMGGWAGAHHIEAQMIKVDDASSPLTKSFGAVSFEHTDEFYIFPPYSPYSRDKQHVLLSINVEKSDRATEGRVCALCTRPDQDYGLAWIKAYGKGRTYFTPLGHTTSFYTDRRWTEHLLAAIQYILGDLDADATPSVRKGTP
ncbi:MAG: ThuA domain-containing protein [Vicinamibacterales bacterium]